MSFQIQSLSVSSTTSAVFQITVEQSTRIYSSFTFSFIVSTSSLFSIGTIVFPIQGNTIAIPFVTSLILVTPSIQTFISGVKASLINTGTGIVPLTLVTSSASISGPQLSFTISYNTSNYYLSQITFSYVVFDIPTLQNYATYRTALFQLRASAANTKYLTQKWAFQGMFFVGLFQVTVNFNDHNTFLLQYTNNSTNDILYFNPSTNSNPYTFRFFQLLIKESIVCSNCPQGNYLFQTQYCVSSCPNGYILQVSPQPATCIFCDPLLLLVPNQGNNGCVCADQYYLNTITRSCLACDSSCLTCNSSIGCTSCGNPTITNRILVNSQCTCLQGFYNQNGNIVCQSCNTDCLSCNGPADTNCILCQVKSSKNILGQCACYAGYTRVNGICTCAPGRIESGNQCIDPVTKSSCSVNQSPLFASNVSIPLIGSACSCVSGYFLMKGTCQQCQPNSTFISALGKCFCNPQFSTATNGSCILCSAPQIFNSESQSCVCPIGFIQNDLGSCIQCGAKQIYLNGLCQCISGYILSGSNCIRCTNGNMCPNPSI